MKQRRFVSKRVIFVFLVVLIVFSLVITYFSAYYNAAKVYSESAGKIGSAGQASVGVFVDRRLDNAAK